MNVNLNNVYRLAVYLHSVFITVLCNMSASCFPLFYVICVPVVYYNSVYIKKWPKYIWLILRISLSENLRIFDLNH